MENQLNSEPINKKNKFLLIYGTGEIARLAYFYFTSAAYSNRYFIKSVKEFLTFKDLFMH